jgi:hypothetical protein
MGAFIIIKIQSLVWEKQKSTALFWGANTQVGITSNDFGDQ